MLKNKGDFGEAEQTYREAQTILEKLVADSPGDRNNRVSLGHNSWDLGYLFSSADRPQDAEKPHRQALAVFEKLATDFPTDTFCRMEQAHSHRNLGHLLQRMERYDEAEHHFRQSVAIHKNLVAGFPNNPDYRWRLAGTNDQLGNLLRAIDRHDEAEASYREAIAVFKKLVAESPTSHDYQWHLGATRSNLTNLLTATGRLEDAADVRREAVTAYSRAIAGQADNSDAWFNRGALYAELGQWQNAASDFAKAAELTPDNIRPRYLGALVHLAAGDREGYRNMCASMVARFAETEDANIAHFASWSCVLAADATDDFSLPVQLANRAVETNPNDVAHIQTLGAVLYRAGRFEVALERLIDANASLEDPTHEARMSPAYGWFFLAMTHRRLGNVDEAQQWLDKATQWTQQVLAERPEGAGTAWNRRLTLELLRHEAEELIGVEADTVTGDAQHAQEE